MPASVRPIVGAAALLCTGARIGHEALARSAKLIGVVWRHQQAGLLVEDRFAEVADLGGDDGPAEAPGRE